MDWLKVEQKLLIIVGGGVKKLDRHHFVMWLRRGVLSIYLQLASLVLFIHIHTNTPLYNRPTPSFPLNK